MRLEGIMKALQGAMLSLAVAMSGLMCPGQDNKIPFMQIQREARFSASASIPANEAAVGHSDGMLPESSSSSSAGSVFVTPTAKVPRTFGPRFFLLHGLHLGMAVLDVELTQHCIANQHCVEGNPLMPSSHAGQLGMNFALVGWGTFVSYKFKKQGSKLWVLSPTVGIAAHTLGIATGIAHW
jgi:hypothetical protein